jgi:hypothetical protein
MTKTILNLTELAVIQDIETVLETYPDHPYQQAFSIPDLRQELIAYVLSHLSNRYVAVDEKHVTLFNSRCKLPYSTEQELCTETLIHQGIQKVLDVNQERLTHQLPDIVAPSCAPSHWFG